MKNRILPFRFLAFFLGLSLVLFQNHGIAALSGEGSDESGQLGLNWTSIGPDNFSGRSRAVLFDSRDASGNTVYAAGVSGGIFKSTNFGLTWSQLNVSSGDVLKVTCMVQAPNGTIYAGTGEDFCVPEFSGLQDYNYTTSFIGSGIWKSDDGINFSAVPGTQPAAYSTSSDWAFINKLAVSPDNGRLFAATNTGLMYLDNGTWKTAMAGYSREVVIATDGTLLTQVNDSSYLAPAGNLNGFVNLSTGTATGLPRLDIGRTVFAIAPSDNNVIYASVTSKTNGYLINAYVSNDKGQTWMVILPGNSTFDPYEGQGCYSSAITVVPDNPEQVILGGTNMWIGRKIQPTGFYSWEQVSFGTTLLLSPFYVPLSHHCYAFRPNDNQTMMIASDGGITVGSFSQGFKFANKLLETTQFYSIGFSYAKQYVIGGGQDIGTQLIDGNLNTPEAARQVWLSTGAGNEGGSGGDAAISLIDPNYIIYSKNGGEIRSSEDRGVTYSLKFPGTGVTNSTNFVMPFAYWESFDFEESRDSVTYYANTVAVPKDSSIVAYSANADFPFYYSVPFALGIGDSVRIQDKIQSRFVTYVTISSETGLYMTKDVLKYTIDPEWFEIAKIADPVTCITFSKDMNYLFAGTKTGKIYRVSNLALAYNYETADINSPTCIVASELVKTFGDGTRAVTSIAFSPQDNNRAVFTLAGYGYEDYVYMTSNALDSIPTFVNVQGNLPKVPVYSSLIEMDNKNMVLVGTDNGIYTTGDIASANWGSDNSGMGTVPVFMLRQQTTYHPYEYIDDNGKLFTYPGVQNLGAIYAATYGKGLFVDTTYIAVGIDPGSNNIGSNDIVSVYPNPVRDEAVVACTLKTKGDVLVIVTDITGKPLTTFTRSCQQAGEFRTTIDMSTYPAGTYIVQVKSASGKAHGKLIKVN